MIKWQVFVFVLMIVVTVILLVTSDLLTWVLEKLGLSGSSEPAAPSPGQAFGWVRAPFVKVQGTNHATGTIEYRGELWSAQCAPDAIDELQPGTRCKIDKTEGLTLVVSKGSGPTSSSG